MKKQDTYHEKSKEELLSLLEEKDSFILTQTQQINALIEMLCIQRHRQFGKKSEKMAVSNEPDTFDEPELPKDIEPLAKADESISEASASDTKEARSKKKTSGRKPLPKELPREKRIYDLSEDEKICACGCALTHIKDDITEQLEIVPAKILVIEHRRKKYACKSCEDTIKTADLPLQPIPKSIASAGLLTHVIVSKYEDHLPLYRQENMLRRIGVDIPRSTLSLWVIRSAELLKPLMDVIQKIILDYDVAYSDETTVQVLKETRKSVHSKKYMWLFAGGKSDQFCFYYRYHPSRSHDVPLDFFKHYQGYIHCDGYSAYDALSEKNKDVTLVGCLYHARRKFVEILNVSKASEGVAYDVVMSMKKLAEIEAHIVGKESEEKRRIRIEQSKPILDKLHAYLTNVQSRTLPKSPLGQAVFYTLNQWPKFLTHLEDGRLENNNNRSERAIKPFVMGRKGWLFADRVRGAEASSILFSLVETCKHHNVPVYSWLRYVLQKMPLCQSEEEIRALLPFHVDPAALL